MPNLLHSPQASQKLVELRKGLQLVDREWKKLLKRKDQLSAKDSELFKKLGKIRAKLHTLVTKMEEESKPINQILKALGVE